MQDSIVTERIRSLQQHLQQENPILVEVVDQFIELDKIGLQLGVLGSRESYSTEISWWPMISVLGTFSAGKSSFINHYLGCSIQKTGNQAVDDKFTVICYSGDQEIRVLPGLALDADPRFPFYQMSEEIEKVAEGEGSRIDSYLQLKTCPADILRGKIIIDSPGFDADSQRRSTLRITDHIINLSDLVLVFFDARHPEPGAMQDTLEHLVAGTVRRNDSNKVLFILNQIDTTAAEDNLEAVVAAWQRAIAQGGLVSGRFYTIYNEDLAVAMGDQDVRQRFQRKRDADLGEIVERIREVSVERAYRIVGALEKFANRVENDIVPEIEMALARWRKRVLLVDLLVMLPILVGVGIYSVAHGYWSSGGFALPWITSARLQPWASAAVLLLLLAVLLALHFNIRRLAARAVANDLPTEGYLGNVQQAFLRNTVWWRSVFANTVRGWGQKMSSKVVTIRDSADQFVQKLNDRYTNPSGKPSGSK